MQQQALDVNPPLTPEQAPDGDPLKADQDKGDASISHDQDQTTMADMTDKQAQYDKTPAEKLMM